MVQRSSQPIAVARAEWYTSVRFSFHFEAISTFTLSAYHCQLDSSQAQVRKSTAETSYAYALRCRTVTPFLLNTFLALVFIAILDGYGFHSYISPV